MSPISGGMTHYNLLDRQGLPKEMQILLRDYPREAWPDHPNFARSIRQWMGAHRMFRQLGEISTGETQLYLDKARDPEEFGARLSEFGNLLVRNLHGHHGWEDHSFFPELETADARLAKGLDLLEADHVELDQVLGDFTERANRVIKLLHLDEALARDEAEGLLDVSTRIEAFLARHLGDEEDLVVPILLHHKLRG